MKRKFQNENNQRRWFELAPVSGYWVAAIVWNDNPGDPFWSFRDFLIGPLFIRTRCSTPTALSLSLSSCLGCSEKNLFHKRWAAGETNSCDPQRSFNESSGMKTFRKNPMKNVERGADQDGPSLDLRPIGWSATLFYGRGRGNFGLRRLSRDVCALTLILNFGKFVLKWENGWFDGWQLP